MKKILFIDRNSGFQNNRKCEGVEGTLTVGTLFNFVTNIVKQRVKNLLFNKTQFDVSNYTSKCDTAYVELNPDFIETLTPKLNTGSTDNPLANNGVQIITPNVKTIAVYKQQLEFVDSVAEVGTSTLKLKDEFVGSLLTKETDPIFTASPAGAIKQTDLDNWNNKLDREADTLQSVTNRGNVTDKDIGIGVPETTARLDVNHNLPLNQIFSSVAEKLRKSRLLNVGRSLPNTDERPLVFYDFPGSNLDRNQPSTWFGINDRFDNSRLSHHAYSGDIRKDSTTRLYNANSEVIFEVSNNENLTTVNLPKATSYLGIGTPIATANLHIVGTVRHENLTNAQGDSTFTKQVVSKPDGTFGIEDKVSNRQVLYVTGRIDQTGNSAPTVTINSQDVNDAQLTFTTQYILNGWYSITVASTLVTLTNYKIEAFIQDKAFGSLAKAITDDTKFEFQNNTMTLLSLRNGVLTNDVIANQFSIHLYKR